MNLDNIRNYLKKAFSELKKVNWLNREETANLTLEVVFFAIIFIIIYGFVDSLLVKLLLILK